MKDKYYKYGFYINLVVLIIALITLIFGGEIIRYFTEPNLSVKLDLVNVEKDLSDEMQFIVIISNHSDKLTTIARDGIAEVQVLGFEDNFIVKLEPDGNYDSYNYSISPMKSKSFVISNDSIIQNYFGEMDSSLVKKIITNFKNSLKELNTELNITLLINTNNNYRFKSNLIRLQPLIIESWLEKEFIGR